MARQDLKRFAIANRLAYPAELEPFLHHVPLPALVRSVNPSITVRFA